MVFLSGNIYLTYLLLGLSLAAPIGPVNTARLDKGIKNGFWHAWCVGFGALTVDAFFMLLVYVGVVKFLDIPIVQSFLWLFGAFVMIYSGIEGVCVTKKLSINAQGPKDSLIKCYLTGFIIAITNPLSIMFWLGIYGSVLAKTATTYGTSSLLLYTSMIFLGLACWDIFVGCLTTIFRTYLNDISIRAISIISGVSLIGFGCYFGYQGLAVLIG